MLPKQSLQHTYCVGMNVMNPESGKLLLFFCIYFENIQSIKLLFFF